MSAKISADTTYALELIAKKGMAPYAAAAKAGIHRTTMYRVMKRMGKKLRPYTRKNSNS